MDTKTNQLIENHLDLARKIAAIRFSRLPASVRRRGLDRDDLTNEAVIALCKIARRYDPRRNVQFSSYASRRLDGAITDYLRLQVPDSRHSYAKVKRGELQPIQMVSETLAFSVPARGNPEHDAITRMDATKVARIAPLNALRFLGRVTDERLAASRGIDPSRISQLRAAETLRVLTRLGINYKSISQAKGGNY